MAIYAKKLNGKQRAWAKLYELETEFEPLFQEDLDSGEIDFEEFARLNVAWYEDHTTDIHLRIGDYPVSERHERSEVIA